MNGAKFSKNIYHLNHWLILDYSESLNTGDNDLKKDAIECCEFKNQSSDDSQSQQRKIYQEANQNSKP